MKTDKLKYDLIDQLIGERVTVLSLITGKKATGRLTCDGAPDGFLWVKPDTKFKVSNVGQIHFSTILTLIVS